MSSLRAAAIPHSSDHHLPFHRSLVFDPSPSCNDTCGQDQTICVHNGDPVPIVSNQEEIPYGLVTFCQQGCEIVAETVMAEGITIVEVFMHVACEEDDYPKVGKDGKPKAGQMNQNDKCVINSPATNTATCRVPLSAVDQNIRDCWNDGARRTTETIIKLTTTAFPDPWTPPDPAQCISSYPNPDKMTVRVQRSRAQHLPRHHLVMAVLSMLKVALNLGKPRALKRNAAVAAAPRVNHLIVFAYRYEQNSPRCRSRVRLENSTLNDDGDNGEDHVEKKIKKTTKRVGAAC